jgi:hypothetical protein
MLGAGFAGLALASAVAVMLTPFQGFHYCIRVKSDDTGIDPDTGNSASPV